MVKRSKRLTKIRSRNNTRKNKSNKTLGLIYYKMNRCKYCNQFEKVLLPKLINYCRNKDLRFYIVVRELNPELIPKRIKKYPSLVKYDKKKKMTIFKDERTLNNLIKFLN